MIEVIQLDGLTMWLIKLISSFFLEIEETMIVQILGILFIGNNAEKLVFHRLKGTGEYNKFFGKGNYNCAGCGTPLYKSTTKFDSGCGWPAFFEGLPGITNRSVSSCLPFFSLHILIKNLIYLEVKHVSNQSIFKLTQLLSLALVDPKTN